MLHRNAFLVLLLGAIVGFSANGAFGTEGKMRHLDSLLGREVSTRPDGDGGRVVDVLIDSQGKVSAAVVEFGGFLGIGTRKIAVEWDAFRIENGAIVVDVTRDKLRAAKEYKPSEPTSTVQAVRD